MTPEQQREADLLKTYLSGQTPMRQKKRSGCLVGLAKLLAFGIVGLALFYGVVAITDPWSFHIGGRATPFLTWHGYGELIANGGLGYPLYVSFYPASHFSQLHREGLRPTGGTQGQGWICTAPGTRQRLRLGGTIYGGWSSTAGSLMSFRLAEQRFSIVGGQRLGFFDLAGHWRGPELVMDERGEQGVIGAPFSTGLRIDHATVTLRWGPYAEFKKLCATPPGRRAQHERPRNAK